MPLVLFVYHTAAWLSESVIQPCYLMLDRFSGNALTVNVRAFRPDNQTFKPLVVLRQYAFGTILLVTWRQNICQWGRLILTYRAFFNYLSRAYGGLLSFAIE